MEAKTWVLPELPPGSMHCPPTRADSRRGPREGSSVGTKEGSVLWLHCAGTTTLTDAQVQVCLAKARGSSLSLKSRTGREGSQKATVYLMNDLEL